MPSLKIDIIVDDKGRPIIDRATASMKELGRTTEHTNSVFQRHAGVIDGLKNSWVKLAGVVGMAYIGRQMLHIADTYTLMDNKLKLVTNSSDQLKSVQEGLYQASLRSYTSYEASVELYSRFARATESLNISQSELLRITETVNKAMIISGATQEEAKNSLIQLSQGLASGALRGDEYRSVVEQSSRVTKVLTDYLNVEIKTLREMASEGKLTADVIINAFKASTDTIDNEFKKMEPTISQAMTNLSTVFGQLISDSNKAGGGTKSVAEEIMKLSDTIEQNKSGILGLFSEIVSWAAKAVHYIGQMGEAINFWKTEAPKTISKGIPLGMTGVNPVFGVGDYVADMLSSKATQTHYNKVLGMAKPTPAAAAPGAIDLTMKPGAKKEDQAGKGNKSGGLSKAKKDAEELHAWLKASVHELDQFEFYSGHMEGLFTENDKRIAKEWIELMSTFDDEYTTATINARNELDALLTAEKNMVDESKGQFEDLKDAIDGWGKDSAKAIADFAVKGAGSFSDMAESIIADLMQMMIYQNITGPLFQGASGFLGGLFGPSGGSSMGFGDWTAGLGFHEGGRVGLDNPSFVRAVPASMFASAPRFHSGLASDEFPAILQKGETVIPKGAAVMPNINFIVNNNTSDQVTQKATPDGNGGVNFEVMIDSAVAKNLSKRSSQSNRTLRNNFGAREPLVTR